MKLDLKKAFIPAVMLTVVVLALQWIFAKIGYPVKQLFAAVPSPITGVTATPGQSVMGWLSGIIPISFTIPSMVMLLISSYLILVVGGFLVDTVKAPALKGRTGRLASIIVWGAAAFYLLIVGTTYPAALKSISGIIGFAVYTLIAAFAVGYISDKAGIKGY